MKLVKKEDLTQVGTDLITRKEKIVSFEYSLVYQLNKLETMKQKVAWAKKYPKNELPTPRPVFNRVSINEAGLPHIEDETPIMDAEVDKTLKFMKEIDRKNITEKTNEIIKNFAEVFAFVNADKVKVIENESTNLNTLTIGDVTKLTEADVLQILLDYADGIYHGEFK